MDIRTTRHKLMLDIGGTFIKCSDGRSIPVDSSGSREGIISSLREAVGDLSRTDSVSIAIPGPFDYNAGVFLMKHKFAAVYGESLPALVEAPDTVKFSFIHDVNCMLLGELACGAARGYENAAVISLGTGLGFSICKDGEILRNEMGSPKISMYGQPFRDGILEDYVSKRGLLRLYAEASGDSDSGLTVKAIANLARSGDKAASGSFLSMGSIIGQAAAPIFAEMGISCVLFGGQISRSFDLMSPAVCEELGGIGCIEKIAPISDFDNATFNGLRAL